ncbi:hypothetical protein TNCV_1269871 [Trichonephila clavipes]|nr:hypothetical protein TNCV_1269871 [Trichonephila clavipes]
MKKTIPYNSESNGKAERANRVLLERVRSLLYESEIENETWDIDSFFEVSPERSELNQNTEDGISSNFEINNARVAIENNSIPLQITSSPHTGRFYLPVLELNDVQNLKSLLEDQKD